MAKADNLKSQQPSKISWGDIKKIKLDDAFRLLKSTGIYKKDGSLKEIYKTGKR